MTEGYGGEVASGRGLSPFLSTHLVQNNHEQVGDYSYGGKELEIDELAASQYLLG